MLELFVVIVVLSLTGLGFTRLIRAQQEARRYLEGHSEAPLQLGHLSTNLAQVAAAARTLRISLDGPHRTVQAYMRPDPTRTIDDLEAVDAALLEATREIDDWLRMVDALPPHEHSDMEAMGASAAPIRAALAAEGGALERNHLHVEGRGSLDQRIEAILAALAKIETALQVPQGPYR